MGGDSRERGGKPGMAVGGGAVGMSGVGGSSVVVWVCGLCSGRGVDWGGGWERSNRIVSIRVASPAVKASKKQRI